MRLLRHLLKPDFETRSKVEEALRKHAIEDPVDRIEGIENMPEHEAEALIQRRIGAFESPVVKTFSAKELNVQETMKQSNAMISAALAAF